MSKLKVFEAFAGIGSQSMALRNINVDYEVVGTMDVDKYAIIAYDSIHNNNEKVEYKTKEEMLEEINSKHIAYNFSTGKSEIPRKEDDLRKLYEAHIRNKNFGDIRLIDENTLPDFDFFTYSFPCKNISNAGQQAGFEEGSGTQSSLVWECRRIIKHKKPKYLMMENVKNLISKKHKPLFDLWCETLEQIGYNNYWKVLNGKDYGVPQNRERVIMISIRKDVDDKTFEMQITNNKKTYITDILENEVDNTYFLSEDKYIDTIDIYNGEKQHKLIYLGLLNTKGNECNRRVYDQKGICCTLNSMNGGNRQPKIRINDKVRKMTPLECWRCQGFKDEDFIKAKRAGLPNSKLYERAGRGIVVPMLETNFKKIFKDYIEN